MLPSGLVSFMQESCGLKLQDGGDSRLFLFLIYILPFFQKQFVSPSLPPFVLTTILWGKLVSEVRQYAWPKVYPADFHDTIGIQTGVSQTFSLQYWIGSQLNISRSFQMIRAVQQIII